MGKFNAGFFAANATRKLNEHIASEDAQLDTILGDCQAPSLCAYVKRVANRKNTEVAAFASVVLVIDVAMADVPKVVTNFNNSSYALHFSSSHRGGQMQVVVVGEPGDGKSRLHGKIVKVASKLVNRLVKLQGGFARDDDNGGGAENDDDDDNDHDSRPFMQNFRMEVAKLRVGILDCFSFVGKLTFDLLKGGANSVFINGDEDNALDGIDKKCGHDAVRIGFNGGAHNHEAVAVARTNSANGGGTSAAVDGNTAFWAPTTYRKLVGGAVADDDLSSAAANGKAASRSTGGALSRRLVCFVGAKVTSDGGGAAISYVADENGKSDNGDDDDGDDEGLDRDESSPQKPLPPASMVSQAPRELSLELTDLSKGENVQAAILLADAIRRRFLAANNGRFAFVVPKASRAAALGFQNRLKRLSAHATTLGDLVVVEICNRASDELIFMFASALEVAIDAFEQQKLCPELVNLTRHATPDDLDIATAAKLAAEFAASKKLPSATDSVTQRMSVILVQPNTVAAASRLVLQCVENHLILLRCMNLEQYSKVPNSKTLGFLHKNFGDVVGLHFDSALVVHSKPICVGFPQEWVGIFRESQVLEMRAQLLRELQQSSPDGEPAKVARVSVTLSNRKTLQRVALQGPLGSTRRTEVIENLVRTFNGSYCDELKKVISARNGTLVSSQAALLAVPPLALNIIPKFQKDQLFLVVVVPSFVEEDSELAQLRQDVLSITTSTVVGNAPGIRWPRSASPLCHALLEGRPLITFADVTCGCKNPSHTATDPTGVVVRCKWATDASAKSAAAVQLDEEESLERSLAELEMAAMEDTKKIQNFVDFTMAKSLLPSSASSSKILYSRFELGELLRILPESVPLMSNIEALRLLQHDDYPRVLLLLPKILDDYEKDASCSFEILATARETLTSLNDGSLLGEMKNEPLNKTATAPEDEAKKKKKKEEKKGKRKEEEKANKESPATAPEDEAKKKKKKEEKRKRKEEEKANKESPATTLEDEAKKKEKKRKRKEEEKANKESPATTLEAAASLQPSVPPMASAESAVARANEETPAAAPEKVEQAKEDEVAVLPRDSVEAPSFANAEILLVIEYEALWYEGELQALDGKSEKINTIITRLSKKRLKRPKKQSWFKQNQNYDYPTREELEKARDVYLSQN